MARKTATPELDAQIADLQKQIDAHQKLLRDVPLKVIGPLLDDALTRIRLRAAALNLPPPSLPPTSNEFTTGTMAVIFSSPPQTGRVLGAGVDPTTGVEYRDVLLRNGQIVRATVEELKEFSRKAALGDTQLLSPRAAPPTAGSAGAQVAAPSAIRPGDTVTSPAGPGRVVRQVPGSDGTYEIMLSDGSTRFFAAYQLKVQAAIPAAP